MQDSIIFFDTDDESVSDWDIFDDHAAELTKVVMHSPVRFSIPSLTKLIKRSGVIDENGIPKTISNSTVEYISDIAYTKLQEIITKSLIILDEREAKILSNIDIYNAINQPNHVIIPK